MNESDLEQGQSQDAPATEVGGATGESSLAACVRLMEEAAARQVQLSEEFSSLNGQTAYQRQQLSQVYDVVRQLGDAVSLQCQQLLQSDQQLRQELSRFQTGGPQRAMAGVFHKLFRDLVQHLGDLDDMLALPEDHAASEGELAWIRSVRVLRDSYESRLKEWGASPVPVAVGEDEFDPEWHELVIDGTSGTSSAERNNVIVRVARRGWLLRGELLEPAQVVVG